MSMFAAKNNTPNDESNIHYPPYFLTNQYYEINIAYFFNSVMIFQLFEEMSIEMSQQIDTFKGYVKIATTCAIILVTIFLGAWIWIYWHLSESASYINAFLLLIPFNILS